MTPEEALKQFEQVTGLRVAAVYDRDSDALWWQLDDRRAGVFECTIGDRTLHIDELGPLT
jgi:hypothetical protein